METPTVNPGLLPDVGPAGFNVPPPDLGLFAALDSPLRQDREGVAGSSEDPESAVRETLERRVRPCVDALIESRDGEDFNAALRKGVRPFEAYMAELEEIREQRLAPKAGEPLDLGFLRDDWRDAFDELRKCLTIIVEETRAPPVDTAPLAAFNYCQAAGILIAYALLTRADELEPGRHDYFMENAATAMLYMGRKAVLLQRAARREGWLFVTSLDGVALRSGVLLEETRTSDGVHVAWPEGRLYGAGRTLHEAIEMFAEALKVAFEAHTRAGAKLHRRAIPIKAALEAQVESVVE